MLGISTAETIVSWTFLSWFIGARIHLPQENKRSYIQEGWF